jgi:hypothetical protein
MVPPMKRVFWLIVAAITAAMILTYLLSMRHAQAAPAPPAAAPAPPARKPIPNPPGLIAFYPRALLRTVKPPPESSLRILGDGTAEDGSHVAFVSNGRKYSILAVLTKDKLRKPEEALFLAPRYVVAKDMMAVQAGKEPLVRVTAGEVLDWAYVYDRNGDGRADYLTYLVGPLPVQDDSFPGDFPLNEASLDHAQLEYLLDHERYIFTHVADEDFDGTVDALVLYVRAPDRLWVKEFAAVLAPGGGAPDSSWTFRRAISLPTGSLARADHGFLRHRIAGKDVLVTQANFAGWTDVLKRINDAALAAKVRFPAAP